jgi:hypothetical protein
MVCDVNVAGGARKAPPLAAAGVRPQAFSRAMTTFIRSRASRIRGSGCR